ncbi:hypothetical protein ACIBL6_34085 [Streptomyces sp. NPDC050400]|uniref:hypothetical protein n=1 Tax=Streptomyces sp. NPDC050400 TaxID=3365610 RepID=UPI00379D72EF
MALDDSDQRRPGRGGGHLVGRGKELAALLARLATARLVSLTGLPGAGRTRLAREAAAQTRRELVWETGTAYEPEQLDGVAARLRHRLGGRRGALLVLDDWEALGGAGTAFVASLLIDLPGLTVLVVADRPRHLRGESVVVLPPLTVPPAGCAPADIVRYEAVELLADAFGEAAVARDPQGAAELCRRFGGVPGPLLEAAAEWLSGGRAVAGIPPGKGQLESAERSYAHCSRVERLLWRRLGVFEGDFERDTVRAVCGSGALPSAEVLGILDRIAPHVLLRDPDTGRYRLPPAQRTVATRASDLEGERWSAVLHHRRWAAGVARQAAEWWSAGRQDEARALALRELPDLRAAMDPATGPLSPHVESGTALDVIVGLWFLWTACGHTAEGRERLRHALALHQAPAPPRALWLAAWLELDLGSPEAADPLLATAWAAAVREGDDHCLGLLAHLRGSVALWQGRPDAAAAEYRDALELLGDIQDFGPGPAGCRASLALALARTDPEAALDAALGGSGGPGLVRDAWAEAWVRYARAEVLRWEGDAGAARLALSALRTFLDYGNVVGAVCAGELLADAAVLRGDVLKAAQLLGAVDALCRTTPPAPYRVPVRRRIEAALKGSTWTQAYATGGRIGLARLVGVG